MRLRSHLLVVSLLTLVPMAVFAIAGAFLLAERERAAFQRGAIDSVRALVTAVDAELRSTVTTLEALSAMPQLDTEDLESFRPHARQILNTQPTWINFVITRPTGEHVLNLLVPDGQKPPASRDHETAARAALTARTVVGNMVSGAVLQRPVFTVRTPVLRDGKAKYVLSAVLDSDSMKALLDAQRIPDTWVAGIIDGNHRFVARSHAPPGQSETVSATLKSALESGQREGWMEGRTLDGVDAYRAFARSSFSGWAVSIAMPRAAVFAASYQAVALLGIGALLAMGAGVILAVLIARRIASPIAELAASAPKLGHGEIDRIPHTKIREVRQLAAALHDAGLQIRDREDELRMANR